ncbi:MAG: NUDIX domain-containing protein [Candidatus Komeilibacteria bacterium]|nr:NUDIX domain-containing protein [Candidatus Komeilibacteria bacterium]
METLEEIKDKEWPEDKSTLKIREASRAVLFGENDLIPLLFVSKYNYHKLPGGGIDEGEGKTQALIREVKEEVGSELKITSEIGQVIEFRSKFNLKQTSYCYLGKIVSKGQPDFTEDELKNGFKLVWLTLDEAISQLEKDKPEDYEGPFIQKRDLVFLKKAKQILWSN